MQAPAYVVSAQCQALASIYNSTDGPAWTDNVNWLTGSQNWYGVTTQHEHVTGLSLPNNQLCGTIPPAVGALTSLSALDLSSNQLSGGIPAEIGDLTDLDELRLSSNQLVGEIPPSIMNLGNLKHGSNNSVSYNGLYTTDSAVLAFMDSNFPLWQYTQTVPPTNIAVKAGGQGIPVVAWTPILYTGDAGYYQVGISQISGGPYTFGSKNRTTSKSDSGLGIAGLAPGENYIVVQTVTPANCNNRNTVTSVLSPEIAVQAPNPFGVPDTSYQALVALYNNTDGPGWTNHSNWLTGSLPWFGSVPRTAT